jgi:TonB-linked SusC/RagA family outer membrane protein
MRNACLTLLATLTVASASAAQDETLARPALQVAARYLPLESARDGTVRMPKAFTRRITVHRTHVSLQQVLLDIATQAGLGLSYGEEVARSNTIVSLDLDNATAAEALAAAVRKTPWAVLITASGQVAVVSNAETMLGAVAGRVSARAGAPLGNATVVIEGTRLRAVSDDSGQYRIASVPAGTYTVAVRRIGYARSSTVATVGETETATVNFALDPMATTLDEIVVTGVPGSAAKRTLGNSITTIDVNAVLQQASNTSVTELLQSKSPGVTVLPGGGSPGTGASIRIRGAGSLATATAPVIYVDGVRIHTGAQGNFWNSWRSQRAGEMAFGAGQDAMAIDMIKPEDIETMEVIKGPAAATLYGAEAANGVIQIITKKGRRGAQSLTWNAKATAGSNDWSVDRVRNYTTCTPALTALDFADGSPQFPGCQSVPANTILDSRSLDLPGALRTGTVEGYTLSLSGGGENHSFFVAGDRDAEEGVFRNSANSRNAVRGNFSLQPRPDLLLAVNVSYSRTHTQFPINDDGFGLIQAAMLYRPGFGVDLTNPLNADGFFGGSPDAVYQWDNHLRANRSLIGATVNYEPLPWLKNRLTVGVDQTSRLADKYLPPGSLWGGATGQAERGAPENALYTIDYAGTVSSRLPFLNLTSALSAGAQYVTNQYRNTVARGTGFASATVRQVSLAAATESFTEISDQKSLGIYVQEQVGWRDRLYVTGAVRVDNNSVFGEDIKQLYYPKLSLAYVISEQPYFERFGWLDQLKLRTAWGQAGSAPQPFAGQRSFTSGPTVDEAGNRVPALRTSAFGNPKIKPERGSEIELGADAALFRNRVGVDFTYYDKTTRDALLAVPVPASTGFVGVRLENLGTISNSGIELGLSATPLQRPMLAWDTRVGLSTNHNELVSFGSDRAPITLSLYQPVQRHQVGFPLGGFWGNFPLRDASGNLVRAAGALVADTQVYIGPSTPTREMSFANSITIRGNIRLHALLDYKGGHYLYNVKDQWRCWGQPLASTWSSDPAARMPGQCWDVNDPGKSDEYKEMRQQDPAINNGLFIQKADFIKFRDVSVAYTLPANLAKRARSERAVFTLAAHNLGFLWKPHYTGPDPEVNFTGVNDPGGQFAYVRVDSWTAPMMRRITGSLQLTF